MDIKSLMVGDWVQLKTYGVSDKFERTEAYMYVKVAEIGSGLITVEYNNDIKEPYRICENTEIEPIPLTPEILEKNGFEHNEIWHNSFADIDSCHIDIQFGYGGKVDNIRIRENGKGSVIPSEKNDIYLAHIEYVHQLQHALRLCGISKEIEL